MTCVQLDAKDPDVVKRKKEASDRHRNSPNSTVKLRYLKKRYGMTVEQYQEKERLQNGLCWICEQPPRGRWNRLHVDHDHKTGKVRGLLCYACNTLLGHANDDPKILQTAIHYLSLYAGVNRT